MHDTVIVGGGIAALTAALFAARNGLATLVVLGDMAGGHLANIERIDDFPGFLNGIAGYELGPIIQEQASMAGAEFKLAEVLALERTGDAWSLDTNEGQVQGTSVIVAAGSRPRPLGVPGEERLNGLGISHCASCDGPLLGGGTVAVIGGGDSAFQEALALAGLGSEVQVFFQGERPVAQAIYQRQVSQQARIVLHPNSAIEEVGGEKYVEYLRYRDAVSGALEQMATVGVFVYAGLVPNTDFLRRVLRLDESGHIPTDIWLQTELPGVFAAGDIRSNSASQAAAAAGDGATAALAAARYLRNPVSRWRPAD
jgi:thioredoxin reductase (NADPH)